MIKRIICAAMICASVFALGSCSGKSSTTATTSPPASVAINEDMQIGELANYVTRYKWVNNDSGDTLNFRNDGSFSGKIDGKDYDGKFTLTRDEKKLGRIIVGVTLSQESKEVKYTIDFKNSSEMTITTDKGKSESYAAEWTVK